MKDAATEPLLTELVHDLRPVEPIPRVREVLTIVLATWVASALLHWVLGGPGPSAPRSEPAYLMVLAGLLLTAVGALLGALTGAIPGRDVCARAGRGLASFGVLLTLLGGVWAIAGTDAGPTATPLAQGMECMWRACALGVLPACVAGFFLGRSGGRRSEVAGAIAALGAMALGGVVVHVSCAMGGAAHLLVGHSLAPLAAGLLLALPLALLVRRVAKHAAG